MRTYSPAFEASKKKGIAAMPIKYHCPNCGKRFVDWGAEKLGFKCPDCGDVELARVGQHDESNVSRRPSLKRIGQRMATRKVAKAEARAEAKNSEEEIEEVSEEEAEEAEEVVEPVGPKEKAVVVEKEGVDLVADDSGDAGEEETLPEDGLPAQGDWAE